MEELKKIVRDKYASIAKKEGQGCGTSCCSPSDPLYDKNNKIMSEDYTELEGYVESADLGLGCGLPTEFAKIKTGDVVVDLGAGAGNDCFIARSETGPTGHVYGIDFTPEMIEKGKENALKLGYENVEFIFGDIESIPLADSIANVVVSNCVFNLVPNKAKAFEETLRILKEGGHFSISDIVIEGELPDALKKDAEMYAGCVAGAIQKQSYLDIIQQTGFKNIQIQKQKPIQLPDSILSQYLSKEEMERFNVDQGIYSITVFGQK